MAKKIDLSDIPGIVLDDENVAVVIDGHTPRFRDLLALGIKSGAITLMAAIR